MYTADTFLDRNGDTMIVVTCVRSRVTINSTMKGNLLTHCSEHMVRLEVGRLQEKLEKGAEDGKAKKTKNTVY